MEYQSHDAPVGRAATLGAFQKLVLICQLEGVLVQNGLLLIEKRLGKGRDGVISETDPPS